MLKKYGKRLLLFLAFFIIMEVTFIINRVIDGSFNEQKEDLTLQRLEETVSSSGAKEKGLNENQAIWDFELKLVRDEFPKDEQIIFEYVDKSIWTESLTNLIESVNSSFISDEDIIASVKEIVPDQFEDKLFKNYMKSIKILEPDLFTNES